MRCQVKRCKSESYLLFYGFGVCEEHWSKHCDNVIDLKKEFKIKDDSIINSIKMAKELGVEIVKDDWKSYFKEDN